MILLLKVSRPRPIFRQIHIKSIPPSNLQMLERISASAVLFSLPNKKEAKKSLLDRVARRVTSFHGTLSR